MADPFYYEKLVILNQVYHNTLIPYHNEEHTIDRIQTRLFPHQQTMVQRMHEYHERMMRGVLIKNQAIHGKVGIVADPIASGKSLSILSYIASYQRKDKQPITCELTAYSTRYFYSHDIYHVTDQPAIHLIIVPHYLFQEWKTEIEKHTTLPHVAIETRRLLRDEELAKQMIESSFVITTNKCYKYVHEYAQQHNIRWDQIFVDEASSIYMNSSDPPLQFQFLWLITNQWIPLLFKNASFHRASLYHLKDQVTLTPLLHPDLDAWLTQTHTSHYDGCLTSSGFFKDYLTFYHPSRHIMVLRNSADWIRSHLPLTDPSVHTIHCRPNISLHSLMSYYLSRHMEPVIHSNKIPHLFQSLGVTFQPAEEYRAQNPPQKQGLIQRNVEDNECVVCLEHAEYPTMVDCCYHLYCGKCLLKSILMNGKCPTCRDLVQPSRMTCFSQLSPEQHLNTKNKGEICLDLIRSFRTGRFIIYSAFDNIYYQLFEEIDRIGLKAERIEGNLFSLLKSIRNFKQGSTQILFISNIEIIRGLSFPSTTHLIFYHDQPSYERKQLLVHSAQRVGRTQPLQIVQLHSEIQV
jgi:hypothetical protein